jgi:hypothetical protein
VNVQSSETQAAVNPACGAAGSGGAVTVTGMTLVFEAPARSVTVRLTLYVLAAAKV